MDRSFTLRGVVNSYTGYGLHAACIVNQFNKWGYGVTLRAVSTVDEPVSPLLRAALDDREEPRPQVMLQPCSFPINQWVDYWFTMHETTTLPQEQVQALSRANALIVPSQWNASCFHAQGLSQPIHICPLGFDPDYFSYTPMKLDRCIFGAAGNPSLSVANRKNLDMAITAFGLAFPTERDVELRIKVLPTCPLANVNDERIKVDRAIFTMEELSRWTQALTAFILPSRCEGWGLYALQAMACGRPVIAAAFGGVTEFFNSLNGYPVDFKLVRPKDCFSELGLWAEPSMESMIAQMRYVYRSRQLAEARGLVASASAKEFTWEKSMRRLEHILWEEPLRGAPAFRESRRTVRLMRLGRKPRSTVFVCGMDDGRGFVGNFAMLATYAMRWKAAFVGNPRFKLIERAVSGWVTDDLGLNRITCQNMADDSEEYYAWLGSLDCLIHLDPRPSTVVYDALTLGIPVVSFICQGPLADSVFSFAGDMEFIDVLRWVYMDKREVEIRARRGESHVL